MRSLVALVATTLVALAAGQVASDSRLGTDDAAMRQVAALRPGHQPWAHVLFAPSAEGVSRGLAVQSVAGLAGFTLAALGLRRRAGRANAPASGD